MRRTAVLLILLQGFVGCGGYSGDKVEDVTSNKAYWGDFQVGPAYVTTRNLLFDGHEFDDCFYWPLNAGVRDRVDYDKYQNDRAAYPGVIEIPAGTRFKIVRIKKIESFEYSAVRTYAQFLDGPSNGAEFSALGISRPRNPGELKVFCLAEGAKP